MNPLLDDAQTHYATARIATTNSGKLVQLWMPCDSSTHSPEYRPPPIRPESNMQDEEDNAVAPNPL